MQRDKQDLLENKMPIYNNQDLVQIKNGNVYPVLLFNASVRPNSASSRVLQRETDPLNHLKRKFYRNSNKPLGSAKIDKDAYFSKREQTTI